MDEILIGIILMVGMAIGFTAFAMWFGKALDDYINRGMVSEERWAEYQANRKAAERYVNDQFFKEIEDRSKNHKNRG